MSSASYLRAQAARMLQQAEQAEQLDKLHDLPVGSVVVFTTENRRGRRSDPLRWAARLVHVEDNPRRNTGDYWYRISSVDANPLRTDDFITWLMSNNAEDIEVVVSTVSLDEWQPPKTDLPTMRGSVE